MIGVVDRAVCIARFIAPAFCIIMLTTVALSQPTPEQRSAIRSACGEDFMANCSGVQPEGADALACLERNVAKLSPSCLSALSAVAPPAAPSAAPPTAAVPAQPAAPPAAAPAPAAGAPAVTAARPNSQVRAAIRAACRSDFMTNCAGIQPGGVEALACLQSNAANLSPACRRAVAAINAGGPGGPKAARAPSDAAPPPAAAAAPPAMPPLPPLAELIIRRRCRPDILTICPLPPGGGRIIECLVANTASLTPRCQGALAEARAMAR
jgi:hypothetical protein